MYIDNFIEAKNTYLKSVDDLVKKSLDFKNDGWEILPHDIYEEGSVGVVLFKKIGKCEVCFSLFYQPYGEIKTEVETTDDPEKFVNFLFSEDSYNCENPKQLKLGAIKYNIKNKSGNLLYCKVGKVFKHSFSEDINEKLKTKSGRGLGPFLSERLKIRDALFPNLEV